MAAGQEVVLVQIAHSGRAAGTSRQTRDFLSPQFSHGLSIDQR